MPLSPSLTVLGCGDVFHSGGRAHTAFLLQTPSQGVLIDCGVTTLYALQRAGIATGALDLILITHFHGDHFGGLPFVLFEAARAKRTAPLTVVTPPGGRQRFEALFELLYPGSLDFLDGLRLDWREYNGADTLDLEGLTLHTQPVRHTEAALPHGLRIEIAGGPTVAYSGDTNWTDTLPLLFRGADLALCDCTFFTTDGEVHLRWTDLQPRLAGLGAKRVVLTHFDTEMLAHLDELPVEAASDGMRMEL